jgi:hypothetical protein
VENVGFADAIRADARHRRVRVGGAIPFASPLLMTGMQPSVIGDRPLRWLGAEFCYQVMSGGTTTISDGRLLGLRHNDDPLPSVQGFELKPIGLPGPSCLRLDRETPLDLQPNDYDRLILIASFGEANTASLGSVTLFYEST